MLHAFATLPVTPQVDSQLLLIHSDCTQICWDVASSLRTSGDPLAQTDRLLLLALQPGTPFQCWALITGTTTVCSIVLSRTCSLILSAFQSLTNSHYSLAMCPYQCNPTIVHMLQILVF